MMKTYTLAISLLFLVNISLSQSVTQKIDNAVKRLMADSSMKHAIFSLYVVNGNSNEVIYDLNSQFGLAPASCQKIFTSIAAMDFLGHDYRFKTELGYDGTIKKDELNGNLFLIGYGDPTLGSWRFSETKDSVVLNKWMSAINSAGIKKINGNIYLDNSKFSFNPIPGGWIWDDIGNYYGAGHWALNWHENQYDLIMQPGLNEGDDVKILRTNPELQANSLIILIKTGKKGRDDIAMDGTGQSGAEHIAIAGPHRGVLAVQRGLTGWGGDLGDPAVWQPYLFDQPAPCGEHRQIGHVEPLAEHEVGRQAVTAQDKVFQLAAGRATRDSSHPIDDVLPRLARRDVPGVPHLEPAHEGAGADPRVVDSHRGAFQLKHSACLPVFV